ncbi:IGF-like family receptor 1 [Tupaia chinensis]|uniref:IGF-like family receptor 1 n=1 Tax=Tupaia chinensis TaxID=246437 RepID=L8Y2W3_TUPCH|nr:IGF-like family receptor 1 [Tupaia chinensis]
MGPGGCLLTAVLLLGQAAPPEASRYCGRLEYWNLDNKCCSSCLQRFGPPPCPDYEFVENCGLNDSGDLLTYPYKECSPGQCNPDGAELCSPCNSRVTAPIPAGSLGRTLRRCSEALLVVLVLLVTLTVILLILWRHGCRPKGNAVTLPYPAFVCRGPDTHSSQGALEASEIGNSWKVSLLPLLCRELPSLESQPLSRLLDELEVLEELIVLLDPEPGPGGGMACGTTRHLAARYGLPAAWSTFAYSLRPSRSPLQALIEMVVAREPSASLGQFGAYLAQIGRADALQVLSKLA